MLNILNSKAWYHRGEMERDTLISHGAAATMNSILCKSSDSYNMVFCLTCNGYAENDALTNETVCRKCGDKANFGKAETSYIFKHLSNLLVPTGMFLRPSLKSQDEYQDMLDLRQEEAKSKIANTAQQLREIEEGGDYEDEDEDKDENDEAGEEAKGDTGDAGDDEGGDEEGGD